MTLRRPLGDSWSPEVAHARLLFVLTFLGGICVYIWGPIWGLQGRIFNIQKGALERGQESSTNKMICGRPLTLS